MMFASITHKTIIMALVCTINYAGVIKQTSKMTKSCNNITKSFLLLKSWHRCADVCTESQSNCSQTHFKTNIVFQQHIIELMIGFN